MAMTGETTGDYESRGLDLEGAENVTSRTHTWVPLFSPPVDMSGLDFLLAMLDGKIPPPPISGTMGFSLAHAEPGLAAFEGEIGEHHYNPMGMVHGGVFAIMLDAALGCSIMTRLPAGVGYATAQLSVHMVRPAFVRTGMIRCEAKAVHVGRSLATAEGRLVGAQDGKLYAHGTTTCSIFPIAP